MRSDDNDVSARDVYELEKERRVAMGVNTACKEVDQILTCSGQVTLSEDAIHGLHQGNGRACVADGLCEGCGLPAL